MISVYLLLDCVLRRRALEPCNGFNGEACVKKKKKAENFVYFKKWPYLCTHKKDFP